MNRNAFTAAHALTRTTVLDGDDYAATFALCLRAIHAGYTAPARYAAWTIADGGAAYEASYAAAKKAMATAYFSKMAKAAPPESVPYTQWTGCSCGSIENKYADVIYRASNCSACNHA